MGATDQSNEGSWLWSDGTPVDTLSPIWTCGEPKDSSSYNCASLREESFSINNVETKRHKLYNSQCSTVQYFICQLKNVSSNHK